MQYTYNVTKQYGRGGESGVGSFYDLSDAKLFIEAKMTADASMGTKVIYRVFKAHDLVYEANPDEQGGGASSSASSQGQSSGARFSPTPFSTTPRPAGSPQKWNIPDEDESKDK